MFLLRWNFLFASLLAFALCSPLLATHPQRSETATFNDFLKGDFNGVSLTSEGKLVLSPECEEMLATEEAFVYSLVANKMGVLYLGTGNNGKVFRIEADGTGKEWAKVEQAGVYALAIDSQNRVYAGAGPDAKIYRFDSAGKAELFFDVKEKYVWALTFDSSDNLFVATGPGGKIYKVSPAGEGTILYDSEETHIVALAWDLNRELLAGTAPGGQVVRLDASGKPFVLLDSALEEVRTIAVDRYGVIYAAAISGGRDESGSKSSTSSSSSSSSDEGKTEESTVSIFGTDKGGQLEVYRIEKDGVSELLYSSDDEIVFDLLMRSDGNLLMATGAKGKVFSLSPKGFLTVLVDTSEEQVTRFYESEGTLYVATANVGKVFKVSPQAAAKGTYESPVVDAGMLARWGTISWTIVDAAEAQKVAVYSRQGNTAKPDRTWTGWEGPYTEAGGSPVKGVASRYLQWKIEFASDGGAGSLLAQKNGVDNVSVTYLQHNQPPRIESVTVHTPGIALTRFPQSNSSGGVPPGGPDGAHINSMPKLLRELESPRVIAPQRKIFIPGARGISWEAKDPNDDILTFSVYLRGASEDSWTLLKEGVEDSEYTIDGISYPSGSYSVKVVASDAASNPAGMARRHELVSRPFVIDNSLPAIEFGAPRPESGGLTLSFSVSTAAAPLYQVEYSVDGGTWLVVFSEDGIVDQTREAFVLQLKALKAGAHVVRVRAVDVNGNVATAQQTATAG